MKALHKTALLAAGVGLLAVGGCSQKTDVDMLNAHYGAMKNHDNKQVEEVRTKSLSVENIFKGISCENDTEDCGKVKALAAVLAADRVASIKSRAFKQPMPKLSTDVQSEGVKQVGQGIPVFGMTTVSYKAIEKDKGTTEISASEGSTVSTSHKEYHSQTTGDYSPPTITVDESQGAAEIPTEEEGEPVAEEVTE